MFQEWLNLRNSIAVTLVSKFFLDLLNGRLSKGFTIISGAVGFGVRSIGNINGEMVQEYLEHHREKPNSPMGHREWNRFKEFHSLPCL